MTEVIHIDGSRGEGGGQILRTSLALSAALGRPFRITGIRAGRDKPGLLRQHLTSLAAAQAICSAEVIGAEPRSQEVEFRPGPVCAGEYSFAVGTAGSTTLVLQAILPALLTAAGPSRITVEGGTHAKSAPPFDFFERALVPLINRMGPRVSARLELHGFYPAGGGRIIVEIEPAPRLLPLTIHERGQPVSRQATILLSQLPFNIADRELEVIRQRLGWEVGPQCIRHADPAFGPGNSVILEIAHDHITEVFSAAGEAGKSAERVAQDATDQVREYLAKEVPIGRHLADQLMIYLALAATGGGGVASMLTSPLSSHATTNTETIAAFLPPPIVKTSGNHCEWTAG